MPRRLEITLREDVLGRLDEARGHEPRASFVKRALDAFLSESESPDLSGRDVGLNVTTNRRGELVRKEPGEMVVETVPAKPVTSLPKIAQKHWAS